MGRWAHALDPLEDEPTSGFVPFEMPKTYSRLRELMESFGPPPPPILAELGACRGEDPTLFYGDDRATIALARAICNTCTVKQQCNDYAESNPKIYGVWGGKSHTDRFDERMPCRAGRVQARLEREQRKAEADAAQQARMAERQAAADAKAARIADLVRERERIRAERELARSYRRQAAMELPMLPQRVGRRPGDPAPDVVVFRRQSPSGVKWVARTRGIAPRVEANSSLGVMEALHSLKEKLECRPEFLPMVLAQMQRYSENELAVQPSLDSIEQSG